MFVTLANNIRGAGITAATQKSSIWKMGSTAKARPNQANQPSSTRTPVPSRAYRALISGRHRWFSPQLYLLNAGSKLVAIACTSRVNSSPLVKSATRRGKQRRLLTPPHFLLHAADFADRCERRLYLCCRATIWCSPTITSIRLCPRVRPGLSYPLGAQSLPFRSRP